MTKKYKRTLKPKTSPVIIAKEKKAANQGSSFFSFFKPSSILKQVLPYSSQFALFAFSTLLKLVNSEEYPNPFYFSENGTYYSFLYQGQYYHFSENIFQVLVTQLLTSSCGNATMDDLYTTNTTQIWNGTLCKSYSHFYFGMGPLITNTTYAGCIINFLNVTMSAYDEMCDSLIKYENKEAGIIIGSIIASVLGGSILIGALIGIIIARCSNSSTKSKSQDEERPLVNDSDDIRIDTDYGTFERRMRINS